MIDFFVCLSVANLFLALSFNGVLGIRSMIGLENMRRLLAQTKEIQSLSANTIRTIPDRGPFKLETRDLILEENGSTEGSTPFVNASEITRFGTNQCKAKVREETSCLTDLSPTQIQSQPIEAETVANELVSLPQSRLACLGQLIIGDLCNRTCRIGTIVCGGKIGRRKCVGVDGKSGKQGCFVQAHFRPSASVCAYEHRNGVV